jgi:hypothetical protein
LCKECPYPCGECDNNAVCTTCNSDTNRTSDIPSCVCESGYFDNDSGCSKCSNACLTCEDTNTKCLACAGNFRNNDKPNCTCILTYYDDALNADCVKCPVDNCDVCDPNSPNTCLTPTEGYYGNPPKKCSVGCKSCSDASSCDECHLSSPIR